MDELRKGRGGIDRKRLGREEQGQREANPLAEKFDV